MKRLFCLLVIALTCVIASPAVACSLAPEGWELVTPRVLADPAGPFVMRLQNYYGAPAPGATIDVVDSAGEVVVGTTGLRNAGDEVVAGDDVDERLPTVLIWTPDAPLAAGETYTANVSFAQDVGPQTSSATLLPTDSLSALDMEIVGAEGFEFSRGATFECCQSENACYTDSCGAMPESNGACETCWATSYTYPVQPNLTVSLGAIPTARYALELTHIPDSGDPLTLGQFQLFGEEQEVVVRGEALPEETPLPICVELAAIDAVDGARTVLGTECIEDAQIERAERKTGPETAPDTCRANSFTEIDENGTRQPIDGPNGKDADGGCSAAGSGAASWLLLLVVGFVRRRRTG